MQVKFLTSPLDWLWFWLFISFWLSWHSVLIRLFWLNEPLSACPGQLPSPCLDAYIKVETVFLSPSSSNFLFVKLISLLLMMSLCDSSFLNYILLKIGVMFVDKVLRRSEGAYIFWLEINVLLIFILIVDLGDEAFLDIFVWDVSGVAKKLVCSVGRLLNGWAFICIFVMLSEHSGFFNGELGYVNKRSRLLIYSRS